jgi:glycosyltransferase involved in cell wall biosynthesis
LRSLEMPVIGRVTVLICTRDGLSRGFLHEAIRSVHEQTSAPSEIILVDDGSADGTASEVRRAYPDVTVLSNDGSGLAAARNTGIRAARSEWIGFIDDDDVWRRTRLFEQLAQAGESDKPESTIWVARTATIGATGNTPVPERTQAQFASWPACLLRCPVTPSGVLISRELLARIGPFNEGLHFGSAYEYWIRCLTAGATVRFSENMLVNLRRHRPQMTDPSNLVAMTLTIHAFLAPYIATLPGVLAARITLGRIMTDLRMCLLRLGVSPAARIWSETPLRPVRLDVRTCCYFVFDSVAARGPHALGNQLRNAGVRLLLSEFQCPDS